MIINTGCRTDIPAYFMEWFLNRIKEDFKKLSTIIGAEKIGWRYDPIFITNKYSMESHIENFEKMAAILSGYTHECVISFIDLYEKTKRNFSEIKEVTKEERIILGKEFVRICSKHDIKIKTCVKGEELSNYGVDCSGCMTKPVIERAIGSTLKVPQRKSTRGACNCLIENDIGVYNNCGHGRVY